ncbi:MAG: DUF4342 domain-containing protein [Chloroflexota bacterium]
MTENTPENKPTLQDAVDNFSDEAIRKTEQLRDNFQRAATENVETVRDNVQRNLTGNTTDIKHNVEGRLQERAKTARGWLAEGNRRLLVIERHDRQVARLPLSFAVIGALVMLFFAWWLVVAVLAVSLFAGLTVRVENGSA